MRMFTTGLAAAVALGIATSAGAENQMEQVRNWLSQLAPELESMTAGLSAGPNLTTCEASENVQECTQRKLEDLSAKTERVRLLLDQNPAPRCLHNTETKIHQMLVMMETTLEVRRDNFPRPATRQRAELMADAIAQFGKDAAEQARRDVLHACLVGKKLFSDQLIFSSFLRVGELKNLRPSFDPHIRRSC